MRTSIDHEIKRNKYLAKHYILFCMTTESSQHKAMIQMVPSGTVV